MGRVNAVLGIDPGKTGCVCLLKGNLEIEFFDWPKDNDLYSVFSKLKEWRRDYNIIGAILEKIHAMPGQGVSSMFTFGTNNGYWEMVLAVCSISCFRPTPQTWQKGLVTKGDGHDAKSRSFAVANRLFPDAELKGPQGGIKDGRCDALLMAWYGAKYFNIQTNIILKHIIPSKAERRRVK